MVFVSTGPMAGVEWGGWHVTLAGRHDYDMTLDAFSRMVRDAIPGLDDVNGGTWKMNVKNSDTNANAVHIKSRTLRGFAERLRAYGVRNVSMTHDFHVTLYHPRGTTPDAKLVRDEWIHPKGPRFSVFVNEVMNGINTL